MPDSQVMQIHTVGEADLEAPHTRLCGRLTDTIWLVKDGIHACAQLLIINSGILYDTAGVNLCTAS